MLRSMLFVPADSERKLVKAESAGADAVILDLEDSVLPEHKPAARVMACDYMHCHKAGPPLWVRINDLASGELLRDLAAVVPARPAGIILPKIRGPEDVTRVANYLEMLETVHGFVAGCIGVLALVTETPSAVLRMGELVQTLVPRLTGVGWGAEDLSSALGAGDPTVPGGRCMRM